MFSTCINDASTSNFRSRDGVSPRAFVSMKRAATGSAVTVGCYNLFFKQKLRISERNTMAYIRQIEPHRYSVSLVTQGNHRFYTLTMPSDVLANTCFVTTRDEDPQKGFQRVLDAKRAEEIANYIDLGFGTIPTSIVLSAQSAADLKVVGRGKTLEFKDDPRAFLILDGQHRVFGFSLAKTSLRVPVVIYNNLTPRDESRLFIDINTKQRPVPNELLLDIKKLAEYENRTENLLGEVFDLFNSDPSSPLLWLLSSHERASSKISRVTFNAGLKQLLAVFAEADPETIYSALESFLSADRKSVV